MAAARLPLALCVAVAFFALGGCSSSPEERGTAPGVTTTSPPAPDEAGESRKMAKGTEVIIEEEAFVPGQLIAEVHQEIKIRNTTSTTKVVRFLNFTPEGSSEASTGPIAPNATFSVRSDTPLSIAFALDGRDDIRGSIQVEIPIDTI